MTVQAVEGSAQWRGRWLGASLVFLACWIVLSVTTALSEPSIGWRLAPDPQGEGLLAYSPSRLVKVSARADAEERIVALRTIGTPAQELRLDSLVAVEAPSMLSRQEDLDRFFTLQHQAWELLEGALERGEAAVEVQKADGQWMQRPVRERAWTELGWLYWVPLLCGVIPFVVGVGVGIYRSGSAGARFLALASVMALLSLAEVAVVAGRLWLLPPWFAEAGQVFVRCTSLTAAWAFCMMMLHYPSPLARAAMWTRASGVFLVVLLVLNIAQWPDSQALRYKLWLVVSSAALIALAVTQGFSRRRDPVHRAAARWLGASAVVSFSIVMYAFLVSFVYGAQGISTSYRWVSVPLLYIGLVMSVGRANLFELERWWVPLVLWYLGGTLVVLSDLALVALLRVDAGAAIALTLLVIGWLYFPARQWLLGRLRSSARPQLVAYVPDLIGAVNAGLQGELAAAQAWRALLERVFAPQGMVRVALEGAGASTSVAVRDEGRQLLVPGVGGRSAWLLTLAHGGRQLFTGEHARFAGQMWQLLDHGLAQQRQTYQAVEQERQRIASDLHDDLGARLLTMVQVGSADGTSTLARQALDEMRQSVRGMAGKPVAAEVALSDWRAEIVSRLQAAGFDVVWEADAPPEGLVLAPRLHVQLAKVLRESVSNVIRHSGGTRCRVSISLDGTDARVSIDDDGQGIKTTSGAGLGLPGIERRARKLGGEHRFARSQLGGARVEVRVPLEPSAQEA
ncbi:MAG: ATP-binding protein [Pseudomonadota bacterium]